MIDWRRVKTTAAGVAPQWERNSERSQRIDATTARPWRLIVPVYGSSRGLGVGPDTGLDDPAQAPLSDVNAGVTYSDRFSPTNRFGTSDGTYYLAGQAFVIPALPSGEAAPLFVSAQRGYGINAASSGVEWGIANALQRMVLANGGRFGESNAVSATVVKWAATGGALTRDALTPFGSLHAKQVSLGVTSDNGKTTIDVQMQSSWHHFMERVLIPAINKSIDDGERPFVAPIVLLAGGPDGQAIYNSAGGVANTLPGTAPAGTTAKCAADRSGLNALVTMKEAGVRLGLPQLGCVFVPPPEVHTPDPDANDLNFERVDRSIESLYDVFIPGYPPIEVVDPAKFETREDNIHQSAKGDFELGGQIASQMQRLFAYEVGETITQA